MYITNDQVLRNAYKAALNGESVIAELRKSSALPASWYNGQFKNLQHVMKVCNNRQNVTFTDLHILAEQLIKHFEKRTPEKLRLAPEIYELISYTLPRIKFEFYLNDKTGAESKLKLIIDKMLEYYRTSSEALENMLPSTTYDPSNQDPEYKAAWDKYFEADKNLRRPAFWRWISVFYSLHSQVQKVKE